MSRRITLLILLTVLTGLLLPAAAALQAPVLTEPSDGATGVAISGMISWQEVPGAIGYLAQIARNTTFNEGFQTTDTPGWASVTRLNFPYLRFNTRYYWRVKCRTRDEESAWSPVSSFTTTDVVPTGVPAEAPSLLPIGKATTTPTISWTAVPGATRYELYLSKRPSMNSNIFNGDAVHVTTPATQFTLPSLFNNTTYYIRVQAVKWGIGPFSDIGMYQTNTGTTELPGSATLGDPGEGNTIPGGPHLFTWQAAPGAAYYMVVFSDDSKFRSGGGETMVIGLQQRYDFLKPNTHYYWRVRGVNSAGLGPWTVGTFITGEKVVPRRG